MKVLVTGGAGYIGSHTCKYLAREGHTVVTYDNLSTGHKELVRWGDFEYGDIRNYMRLRSVIHKHNPDGIIHFASSISVGESVVDPGLYYENNVCGSLTILQALQDEGVRPLVVSGSAAVYGLTGDQAVSEDVAPSPINPYGRTKLILEWMLKDFEIAHKLPWVALRYFNAAGADIEGDTGEWHDPETHLIPNVLKALDKNHKPLRLFGNDYPTPDGTCIRDYIHVLDLAQAHVLALKHLIKGNPSQSFNLGTGTGTSILEIITAAEKITGKTVQYSICPRRKGDPVRLVANADLAKKILGWTPMYSTIDNIVKTAWKWECKNATRL